jgi:hypothetical protein
MFEFHGWFTISETPEDYDVGGLETIIVNLRKYLDAMEWPSGFADLRVLNGIPFLSITGHPNRPRNYHQHLDALLTFIKQHAPGSYGLLYWRDDEDDRPPGRDNFHVHVLAKGTVVERFDPFLSPAIPTIENS